MMPSVDVPFFVAAGQPAEPNQPAVRHPQCGRFLRLEPDRLVEMTWVTGVGGAEGAETVVIVELIDQR